MELDFPLIPLVEGNSSERSSIPETLNGASINNVLKTVSAPDLIVELNLSEVVNVRPNVAELFQCAGRGVTVAGAPVGSSYDFFSLVSSAQIYGLTEDPVCGSVYIVPWLLTGGKKLGKQLMTAFMASPRSGTHHLQWDEAAQGVRIRGKAVTTIMVGTLLV